MAKLERLAFVKKQLGQLADFLYDYLPLANIHTVDFLVDDTWLNAVPKTIRKELQDLSHNNLVRLPLPLVSLDFKDSEMAKRKDCVVGAASDYTTRTPGRRPSFNRNAKTSWRHEHLMDFVRAAHSHTLGNLGVIAELQDILQSGEKQSFYITQFMNAKKAHEVDMMAAVCHSMCADSNIHQVVDIGSGLGYLSGHLAFLHGLQVLGIDACNSNTHGAELRTSRLAKHWPLLLANAQLAQKGLPPVKTKGKKKRKKHEPEKDFTDISKDTCIPPEQYSSMVDSLRKIDQLSPKGKYVPVTMFVTQKTNLLDLLGTHFKVPCTSGLTVAQVTEISERMAEAVSADPSPEKSDESSAQHSKEASGDQATATETCDEFMMTGLHTCGNLASSVIKLFVGNSHATRLCNIGCCYHLLEEEFIRNPFLHDDEKDAEDIGFPMSQCLKEREYFLGRNARMLACLAPERLAAADDESQGPEHALHWRALLQVILRDVTGEVRLDWNVGKLANKCSSFVQYARKALNKLKIEHSLSDEDLERYADQFKDGKAEIKHFFYLRAVLTSCIESLILLDRLAYLLEQDCVKDAFLLEMFDPKTSPRCYALVAFK